MDELTFVAEGRPPTHGAAEARAHARARLDVAIHRERGTARRTPRLGLVAALLAVALLAVPAVVLARQVLPVDYRGWLRLDGPAAPRESQEALRDLFPPLAIGPARTLAEHDGRTLFGARTGSGGYCFSATSPVDPGAQGGHCVSDAETRRLNHRGVVAFAMSGRSVGGYASGAESVRITGAGLDVLVPVNARGWWIGVADLPSPPLGDGDDEETVVATALTADGRELGSDALLQIMRSPSGDAYTIAVR